MINIKNINKKNYFLTGAGESAIIYLYQTLNGACRVMHNNSVVYFSNGVANIFTDKQGLVKLKTGILEMSSSKLNNEFKRWSKKWQEYDDELFKYAMGSGNNNWKKKWQRLDEICEKLWFDSYKVESLDNFSDEIEKTIIKNLKKLNVSVKYFNELILPSIPTKVQEVSIDRLKVKNKEMTKGKYVKKYWFMHGNWAGGEILTEDLLKKDLKQSDKKINFEDRKKIHKMLENKLDKNILNIIKMLRILALWRDERKCYVQKICLGYRQIAKEVARNLCVSIKAVEWMTYNEIDFVKKRENEIVNRFNKSSIIFNKGKSNHRILNNCETDMIFNEFSNVDKINKIKGNVACRGKVIGKVKIILKKEEFDSFKKGNILVTTMTRPEFTPLMKKAKAVITDEGGLTSHAAIVSRELNVPCIIGTRDATKILKNGVEVEVDADEGVVKIL